MSVQEITQGSVALDAGATTDEERYVTVSMPGKWKLKAAFFTDDAGITADASNNSILTLSIAGTTVGVITTDLTQGDLDAGDPAEFDLTDSSVVGVLELSQGEAVKLAKTHASSGVAVDGQLTCLFEKVRS